MTTAITQIYLLMEEQNPVGAYLDKALADADCWNCNDAQRYLDMEQFNYWVRTVNLMVDNSTIQ